MLWLAQAQAYVIRTSTLYIVGPDKKTGSDPSSIPLSRVRGNEGAFSISTYLNQSAFAYRTSLCPAELLLVDP
jgi:hypothetical protein